MKTLFVIFALIVNGLYAVAQQSLLTPADSLVKKIELYGKSNPADALFAHFDKTIYTNNESVWFTAYLLNSKSISQNTLLSVALVSDNDHKIALQEKFIMADGLAFGNILLPDTIPPGNYSFLMYTNMVSNNNPLASFVQPVTIKNSSAASFNAFLQLTDTASSIPGTIQKVLLVTDGPGRKIIAGAQVSYRLGNTSYQASGSKQKTDNAGQYLFKIPVTDIKQGNNMLEAKITYGKAVKYVRKALPVSHDVPSIKFYPEGGSLVGGLPCTIGWEAKNAAGNPLKVSATLFENNRPVNQITKDNYGMGRFIIIPSPGSVYEVKIAGSDKSFQLPSPVGSQPEIIINHAICYDTLRVIIKASRYGKYHIIIHNYRESFYALQANVDETGKILKVALTDVPKGVAAVTVLDSLQRPCAERLFYAHYDQRNTVVINSDRTEYATRQKVNLKLKIQDAGGLPVQGLVSVACVQASRLDPLKPNNIENYLYLDHQLNTFSPGDLTGGLGKAQRAYLENVLLIKGWRKYNWPDLTKVSPADSDLTYNRLRFSGKVTHGKKPLKKSVNLVVMRDQGISTLSTTSAGQFTLPDSEIYTHAEKKFYLFVANGFENDYDYNVTDPYLRLNQSLAETIEKRPAIYAQQESSNTDDDDLNGFEHAIRLKEVEIKADGNNIQSGKLGRNDCGDYVCTYNILNCRNHVNDPANTQPIPGRVYWINGNRQTYQGCNVIHHDFAFTGIHYAMQFYGADYSQVNPSQPDYVSTIYWKHLCKIDTNGETELSFFTGDITGPFKIIVQGITDNGVTYGERTIAVRKATR